MATCGSDTALNEGGTVFEAGVPGPLPRAIFVVINDTGHSLDGCPRVFADARRPLPSTSLVFVRAGL